MMLLNGLLVNRENIDSNQKWGEQPIFPFYTAAKKYKRNAGGAVG